MACGGKTMSQEQQTKRETVTVDQAADILGVHQETIRRLLRDNILKGHKTFTGQWKVDREHLQDFAKTYRE
jgi:excisionase family DNA binding protein